MITDMRCGADGVWHVPAPSDKNPSILFISAQPSETSRKIESGSDIPFPDAWPDGNGKPSEDGRGEPFGIW